MGELCNQYAENVGGRRNQYAEFETLTNGGDIMFFTYVESIQI